MCETLGVVRCDDEVIHFVCAFLRWVACGLRFYAGDNCPGFFVMLQLFRLSVNDLCNSACENGARVEFMQIVT